MPKMGSDEGEGVAHRDFVGSQESCVDLECVHRLHRRCEDWTLFGRTRLEVSLNEDRSLIRIEPDNVQGELHAIHPKAHVGFVVEDEQHSMIRSHEIAA